MKIICFAFIVFLSQAIHAFAQPRNLVLITIDTLRADFLSCNGSTRVKTPNMDALAAQGVNFQRARASVPLTLPSHTSIFTALYPPSHGVRDNGSFRLHEKHVTLAEILKLQGYETAAFVGSFVLDHRFGLNQGFDVYDDQTWQNAGTMERLEAERNGEAVYDAFAKWLTSYSEKKPFFAWIHLYDPHFPYNPPEDFKAKYPKKPYAGEVAYTDSIVGRIVKDLETRKLFGNSIITLTSDHGEGLGEHGEHTHSVFIYNSTLHVPMIIVAPQLIAPSVKIPDLCRTIDLAPTLLDYLGIKKPLGEGVSLRNLIEGKPQKEIISHSESLYAKLNMGWSELVGLETKSYHYIEAPKPELYEIQKDPKETENRIASSRAIAQRMSQELQKSYTTMSPDVQTIDEETREKLASLGYVSSAPSKSAEGAKAVDPKDKIEVWNEMQMILHAIDIKDFEIAITALKQLKGKETGMPMIHQTLGMAYMYSGDLVNAEKTFREALQLGMDSSATHLNLGVIAYYQKQFDKAEKELRIAIAMDPTSATAHFRLGNVFRAKREFQKALDEFIQSLKINPDYVFALDGLGDTYAAMNRHQDAARAYERAIQIDPSYPPVYSSFAILMEQVNPEKACDLHAKFLKLSESEPRKFTMQRQRATKFIKTCKNTSP
jgi:arylsulfatase A-like enzyme/Tfp pilus assembly protein PilF